MLSSYASKLMQKRFFLSCVSSIAIFLAFPLHGPSLGQDQTTTIDRNLRHEVTVTLKLVQVYVNDKKGQPVTDLIRSDFALWDNGRSREITSFENHTMALPEIKQQDDMVSGLPTKTHPILNRKFFMIFDFFRNDLAGIKRAKKAALYFLEKKLSPDDEVAILSFSAKRGLILHQNSTLDHEKAKKVVQMTKGMTYFKTFDSQFEERLNLEDSNEDIDEAGGGQIMDLRGILKDYFESMKELAKALRYTPGFKNIIFFSGGLSYALIYKKPVQIFPEEIVYGVGGSDENFGVSLLGNRNSSWILDQYEEMVKEFTSANCPIYTVDTEGNRAPFGRKDLRGEHSLKELSDLTGGRYFSDVNNYEVVADFIQNVTKNYYVLGYNIDEKWDGKYHSIKVKIRREGLEVVAQKGYFNPRPFNEYSPFEKKLHLLDLSLSENPQSQVPEAFPLLAFLAPKDQGSNCLILSEIQPDLMRAVAGKKAEVISLAINGAGAISSARRGEIDFYSLPSRRIYLYAGFSLRPGTYECKTIIRNLETGKAAVGVAFLTIPEPLSTGLKLYPVLLLLPDSEAYYLGASKKNESGESLSLRKIYPVLQPNNIPIMDELDEGVRRILAGVRYSVPDISDPDIKVSVMLRNKTTSEEISLVHKTLKVQREGQDVVLLAELEIPQLVRNVYELCVAVKDGRSQSHDQTSRPIRLGKSPQKK